MRTMQNAFPSRFADRLISARQALVLMLFPLLVVAARMPPQPASQNSAGVAAGNTLTHVRTLATRKLTHMGELCNDDCSYEDDGGCDDGGLGSEYQDCTRGTDCTDCGPRAAVVTFDFDAASIPGWSTPADFSSFAFTHNSGGTPSSVTGPDDGFGRSGYYYFAEASSPRAPGDLFTLRYDGSECTSYGDIVAYIIFMYHMYGTGTVRAAVFELSVLPCALLPFTSWSHFFARSQGDLSVLDAAGTPLWAKNGQQGIGWRRAQVDVQSASFTLQYVRGPGYRGDTAIVSRWLVLGYHPPRLLHHRPRPCHHRHRSIQEGLS